MRSSLVAALVEFADGPWKARARRFLLGLSSDELQYIAQYLGGRMLDGSLCTPGGEACSTSEDRALKAILVKEYLCVAGMERG